MTAWSAVRHWTLVQCGGQPGRAVVRPSMWPRGSVTTGKSGRALTNEQTVAATSPVVGHRGADGPRLDGVQVDVIDPRGGFPGKTGGVVGSDGLVGSQVITGTCEFVKRS